MLCGAIIYVYLHNFISPMERILFLLNKSIRTFRYIYLFFTI